MDARPRPHRPPFPCCRQLAGGAGPRRKWDVTVLVATTAVRIIGLDEGNHVCGVPAVHTGNSWWDESDEENVVIVGMIQTYCYELRAYALAF